MLEGASYALSESSTLIRYKTIFIIHLIINRMRKFTLLLTLLLAFMTTAIAQIDTSKEYRVKHTTTGKVMNASNYDDHPTGPLGGVNFVEEAESDDQVFLFEADGSGYKLKTKSGKYIYCQAWNVDALDQASTLTFSNNGDGTYKIGCDKGYFKVENVTGSPVVKENGAEVTKEQVSGDFPFCDAGYTAAANFELVEVEAGTPEVPEVPEVGGEDEATLAAIEKAEGVLAKTGVGYPVAESASRAALVAAVEEAKAAPTTENGTKVNAALATYLAETDVTLPETGKAYTFTMVAKNGNKFYLNYTGQDVAMVAANGEALPESAKFVATANGDGTYTFQTNDGNYLVYHSKYAGVSWLQVASTTGFQAEKDDMTNITLAKLSKGNNVAATDEQVFGLVSWYSMRGIRSDNGANEMGYMVLKADGSDYDGASAPYWNDNFSSAFLVEEAEVTTPETPEVPNAELAETYTGTCNINFMGAPTEANVSLNFDKDGEGNAKAGYAYLLFSNVELGPVFNAEVPYEVKGNTVVLKGIEVATEEKSEDTKEVDLTFTVQEDGKLLSNDQVYGPGFLSSILFDFSQCPLAPKSEVVEPEQPEQPEVPAGPVVITDVAQLSNAKCYTLVSSDTGRGGMYALADKVDMCGVTYSAGTDACHSVARNNADPKQQFAFVEYDGKLYLYSVSEKKFVMKSGNTNALVGEAPFEHVVVEKVGENTFALQANGTHYFTASPGWCSNASRGTCVQSTLNSHSSDDGWDNGAWYTITEVADFDATEALALLNPSAPVGPSEAEVTALLEKATQALAFDGVGYPVDAKRETLNTVKAALETEVTQDNYNALVATLTEYVATTDVRMPESGKAYTFVSKQKNGTLYYLTYTSNGVVTTTNVAEATPFVCKTLENGKFVFVNNAGKYMIWKGNTAGLNGAKGYYDSYDTSAASWCDIELTKVIEGAQVEAGNEEKLFGCMFFKGRREASGTNQFNYTVIKSDGIYDQASVPFFNDNFSSAMMLVEATYPNKPELKAADGLDVAAIATYSAPFATVVPEGVTAWYAQSEGGDYVSMTEVEGAIPANTGVVLTSETTGTVTMVPAAAEELATVSDNLLSAAAAAGDCEVEAETNAYVIGKADDVVAFYPLSATNRTIAQSKSFLVLPTASPVVKMNFGGESTAIETVEKVDANAPIYDLSGRRVVNMTNGGVYIQNGKKFIVK